MAPAPTSTSTVPIRTRRRMVDSGRATSSRSAAIGAIREARRAGSSAATAVTPTPTTYDQNTADQVIGKSARLRSSPNTPKSQRSPSASR